MQSHNDSFEMRLAIQLLNNSQTVEGVTTHRLAMDERMLLDARTGVATYARGLRAAQTVIGGEALLIADRKDVDALPKAPCGRGGRWLRALRGTSRTPATTDKERYTVPDLFRLAQVHFDLWQRPLTICLPAPPGIVHWTYPLPIYVRGWKNVYTVHDAIPLTSPHLTPVNAARHRRLLDAIARRAVAFVTVSQAARDEIVKATGYSPNRIVSCGQAVSTPQISEYRPWRILRPRGYFLVVGAIEIRKNILTIIEAHHRSGSSLPLVIVGPDGWGANAILEKAARPAVLRLPFLPLPALQRLIAEARALLMVSKAEGFGLPIAEAMALGTPVITSCLGAQAETAGDAALLVHPDDVEAISRAINRLDRDSLLSEQLVAKGYVRAQDHSPCRFTERLKAFYATLPADGTVAVS